MICSLQKLQRSETRLSIKEEGPRGSGSRKGSPHRMQTCMDFSFSKGFLYSSCEKPLGRPILVSIPPPSQDVRLRRLEISFSTRMASQDSRKKRAPFYFEGITAPMGLILYSIRR